MMVVYCYRRSGSVDFTKRKTERLRICNILTTQASVFLVVSSQDLTVFEIN